MELNELISSGILEAQYLGFNSKADQEMVIALAENDPELGVYIDQLGIQIETHFKSNAVPPPPSVRQVVLERTTRRELQKMKKEQPHSENGASGPKFIDIEVNDTYIKVHKYWRPAFIAVFILSKIFLILGLYFYFKSASLEKEVKQLKSSTESVGSQ